MRKMLKIMNLIMKVDINLHKGIVNNVELCYNMIVNFVSRKFMGVNYGGKIRRTRVCCK